MQCDTLGCAILLVVLAAIASDNFQRTLIDETEKNQLNLVIELSLKLNPLKERAEPEYSRYGDS